MAIDTSGKWWKGSDASDITKYLQALKPGGYPVTRTITAQCICGGTRFNVHVDDDEELARTSCTKCGKQSYVGDSGEHWSTTKPRQIKCPCRATEFEVALGLFIKEESWVRWMSIGVRCIKCGVLSGPLDWKSDAELTDVAALHIGG